MDKVLLYNRLTEVLKLIQDSKDQESDDKLVDVLNYIWDNMTRTQQNQVS